MKGSIFGKKKTLKIVLWCILAIILLLIVTITGSLFVQKYIKKASVPMFMGRAFLIVSTGSMNGTINQWDMIIIKKTNDYTLGDIVTYVEVEGQVPVTHRIVNYGTKEGTFITKGDANDSSDIFPISEEQIAGEVVHVIPKLGLFFNWFTTGGGIIYIISMIAVVIVGMYFLDLINESHTDTHIDTDNTTDDSDSSDKNNKT